MIWRAWINLIWILELKGTRRSEFLISLINLSRISMLNIKLLNSRYQSGDLCSLAISWNKETVQKWEKILVLIGRIDPIQRILWGETNSSHTQTLKTGSWTQRRCWIISKAQWIYSVNQLPILQSQMRNSFLMRSGLVLMNTSSNRMSSGKLISKRGNKRKDQLRPKWENHKHLRARGRERCIEIIHSCWNRDTKPHQSPLSDNRP